MTLRLLLLDHDTSSRRALLSALMAAGHQVDAVAVRSAAAARLLSGPCDLVVVDEGPAEGEVASWLAEQQAAAGPTPVIVLANGWRPPTHLVALAHACGASGLLIKPFPEAELLAHIAAICGPGEPAEPVATSTDAPPLSAFELAMADLRLSYGATLPEKLAELHELLAVAATSGTVEAMEACVRAAHKLRGTGGSYGFMSMSAVAGVIEDQIGAVLAGRLRAMPLFWQRLQEAVARVREEMDEPAPKTRALDSDAGGSAGAVLFVAMEADFAAAAGAGLAAQGAAVEMADATATVLGALERHQPSVVVASGCGAGLSGFDMARLIRGSKRWRHLRIVLAVEDGDAHGQQAASAAGADGVVGQRWLGGESVAVILGLRFPE